MRCAMKRNPRPLERVGVSKPLSLIIGSDDGSYNSEWSRSMPATERIRIGYVHKHERTNWQRRIMMVEILVNWSVSANVRFHDIE